MRIADQALLAAGVVLPVVVAFSNALAEIASAVLILAVIARVALGRPRWPSGRAFAGLLGVWLIACLLSVAFAADPAHAFRAFSRKTLEYATVALGMSFVGREARQLQLVLKTLAWAGVVFSIDGLLQWRLGHDLLRWHAPWASRLTGPMDNPNNFATYLVMVMPIQLWAIFAMTKRWQAVLLSLGIVSAIPPLILTDSRLAWLLFSFGVLAFLGLTKRMVLLGYLVLLGLGVVRFQQPASLPELFELSPGRVEGWTIAWRMFLDHPFVGIGLGSYMDHYMSYLTSHAGTWPRPQYAHNCYLQLLAEGGVIGLGAFLLSVGWVLAKVWRQLRSSSEGVRSPLHGLIVSLLVFFVSMAFDTGLYSLPIALLFWSLLGLAAGAAQAVRPRPA